ncbi:MAG: DUF3747 domain-containing protein [Acaryochloris sp. SU_5_25]|nr:DUF3747 domain-containing protein [Acaryochloris sp. SU_5_25]
MKHQLSYTTVAIAGWLLSFLMPQISAQAYTFGQKEVDQSKLIAIAVPFAQAKQYNLIILEQISSTQTCWKEHPDQPGVIDPLLLKFDFTGICGRSTDSNGYSIRQAGLDLALDYRLSLVKHSDHLVLMGYPLKNPSAPKLIIGQTRSFAPGFLKIDLAPGWRFTKRTYDGKTLGHIYFTQDRNADPITSTPSLRTPTRPIRSAPPPDASPQQLAILRPRPTITSSLSQRSLKKQPSKHLQPPSPPGKAPQRNPSTLENIQSPSSTHRQERDALTTLITSPIEIPVPEPSQRSPQPLADPQQPALPDNVPPPSSEQDADLPILSGEQETISPPSSPSKGNHYQSSNSSRPRSRKSITLAAAPPLLPTTFSKPIEIPVPPPISPNRSPASPTFLKRPFTPPLPPSSFFNRRPTPFAPALETDNLPENPLPVPAEDAPLGRFDPDPDIYIASRDDGHADILAALNSGDPPPPPADERSRLKYRVVVKATNTQEQAQIKTLVPDAFRSSYQGSPVLQVGAYESQAEADAKLELLSQAGLMGIIEVR